MGISELSKYNNQNYYSSSKAVGDSKRDNCVQSGKAESSFASNVKKAESAVESRESQRYLEKLKNNNPQINILSGNKDIGRTKNGNSKTDVMIAPSILNQMATDPEAAKKYEKMLSDIPALDQWANSMIRAMTGSEVKYRQVWIDEDGNMGSFCITGPNEQSKKAEMQEEYAERLKKQKEKRQELSERLHNRGNSVSEDAYMKSILKLVSLDYKA